MADMIVKTPFRNIFTNCMMIRKEIFFIILAFGSFLAAFCKTTEKAEFSWPDLPGPEEIQEAMEFPSNSGLVILDRNCKIEIKSFGQAETGIKKEDFIRFLIINEEGVRNASISINDDPHAKIEHVEGRTVLPDGKISRIDKSMDFKAFELTMLDREKTLFANLGFVNFPAPEKGAILDLFCITYIDYEFRAPFFMVQKMLPGENSSIKEEFHITIKGGIPGFPWSVLTFGDEKRASSIIPDGNDKLKVLLGPYRSIRSEPFSPPEVFKQPTVLCYINLSSAKIDLSQNTLYSAEFARDDRERWVNPKIMDGPYKEWWIQHLKNRAKDYREFTGKGDVMEGKNKLVFPSADLPVEERLKILYRYTQETLKYDPDSKATSLSDMLKKGMSSSLEGTLFFSCLLDKARIDHRLALIADRYRLPFSPLITNAGIFGFGTAVMVEIPEKGTLFMMPGHLSLPFSCLPMPYQDSLAICLDGDNGLSFRYTPVNLLELDTITCKFDVTMDLSGDVDGKITLLKSGTPSEEFRDWHRLFKLSEESSEEKRRKKGKSGPDMRKEMERQIKEEFTLAGSRLSLDSFEVVNVPRDPSLPIELSCHMTGTQLATPSQDRSLLYVNPILAGMTNPFSQPNRRRPIWMEEGGKITVEGVIRLPHGSKIHGLPESAAISGPDNIQAAFEAWESQENGRTAVHSKISYELPAIVGRDQYAAFKNYLSAVARFAQEKCLIEIQVERELE